MTEKQIKLVNDYGPEFYCRAKKIEDEILYLTADAISIMTYEEWKDCGEAMEKFVKELNRTMKIAHQRMKEAGLPVR